MKWPNERQGVTIAIFIVGAVLLWMAHDNPLLWDVKLFEIIVQATFVSGIFGSIVALHFSANKSDEAKTQNTARAFAAIEATAKAGAVPVDAKQAADDVALAATQKADEIGGEQEEYKSAE